MCEGRRVISIHPFLLKWPARRLEPITLAWNGFRQKQLNKTAGSLPPRIHHTSGLILHYSTTWLENKKSTRTQGCAGFHTPEYTNAPHSASCIHVGKDSPWSVLHFRVDLRVFAFLSIFMFCEHAHTTPEPVQMSWEISCFSEKCSISLNMGQEGIRGILEQILNGLKSLSVLSQSFNKSYPFHPRISGVTMTTCFDRTHHWQD